MCSRGAKLGIIKMSESRTALRKAFHQLRSLLTAAQSPERLSSAIVSHLCEVRAQRRWSEGELRAYHMARRQGLSMQEATHAALLATQLEVHSLADLLNRLQVDKPRGHSPPTGLHKRHKPACPMP